jgi:hypothetical protein
MTEYELLKCAESTCRKMVENGIKPEDVKYLEVYEEWKRLRGEGHKVRYISYYLSQQYGVGEATIFRIAKRFEKPIK